MIGKEEPKGYTLWLWINEPLDSKVVSTLSLFLPSLFFGIFELYFLYGDSNEC